MTPSQIEILTKIAMKHAELGIDATFEPPPVEGPVLTAFRFTPKGKTRVSHLESLANDYAMTTGTESVVVKRMPGDSCVSLFIPNKTPVFPKFLDLASQAWSQYHNPKSENKIKVPILLGMNWLGEASVFDLSEQPHLLVAGTTGSGKSNLMRGLLTATVYSLNSSLVKLVLSDTKAVEFQVFDRVPHLLFPRAQSAYQTTEQWDLLCKESDERLKLFSNCGVTNIHEYNAKATLSLNSQFFSYLPFIIVVVDELADILDLGKLAISKLDYIVRKSRAAGIYMIAGTQRPSVSVVAGQIKANFPARLCFRTSSMTDSRVILDTNGAENLLEKGDMLFKPGSGSSLHRLHAPLVRIDDAKAIVDLILLTNEQIGAR